MHACMCNKWIVIKAHARIHTRTCILGDSKLKNESLNGSSNKCEWGILTCENQRYGEHPRACGDQIALRSYLWTPLPEPIHWKDWKLSSWPTRGESHHLTKRFFTTTKKWGEIQQLYRGRKSWGTQAWRSLLGIILLFTKNQTYGIFSISLRILVARS